MKSGGRFEDESKTRLVIKDINEASTNTEDIKSEKFLETFKKLDFSSHFIDHVRNILEISSQEYPTVKDVRNILYKRAVCITKSDKKNINNWLNDNNEKRKLPRSDSRDTIYRICLGLGLTIEQTYEFFLKGCMFLPFDPKCRNDVVYYYCIKNRKSAEEAARFIKDIEAMGISSNDNKSSTETTMEIDSQMKKINSDDSLKAYIFRNCYGKRDFSRSKEYIRALEKKLADKKISWQYSTPKPEIPDAREEKLDKNCKKENIKMTWDNIRYTLEEKQFGNDEIESVRIALEYISKTFPIYSSDKIEKYNGNISELYRRTLMVLYLYAYFYGLINDERVADNDKSLEDFENSLNGLLINCGLMQIYHRNPFDYLILLCASKCNCNNRDKPAAIKAFCDIVGLLFFEIPCH